METTTAHPNKEIVDKFFDAYGRHDIDAIKEVMEENVTWYFMGRHPLAGIKKGVDELVAFFDKMAAIMAKSDSKIEKVIVAENERHLIECQRSKTHREDGNNLNHYTTVLWTIEGGKITEGRHFFADPEAVDNYFTAVVEP